MTYQPRNPNGQAVMANSEPVVIASDQSDIPVTLASGANVIGSIAQITTGITPGTGLTNLGKAISNVSPLSGDVGVLALAINSSTAQYTPLFVDPSLRLVTTVSTILPGTAAANLGKAEDTVHANGDTGVFVLGVSASAATVYGASGDYTPFSVDTAGRQRVIGAVAQNVAPSGDIVLVGGYATGTPTTQVSVDGRAAWIMLDRMGRVVTTTKCGTTNTTSVAGTTSTAILLSTSVARVGATIYNDSAAILYVLLGTGTPSATAFTVKLQPDDYWEVPFGWLGQINGTWASATGAARITELS
jgi:hypothetical protein